MVTSIQPSTAAVSTWAIDPAHSVVEFSVKHMMFATVKGRFTGVAGTINLDEQNLANSSVDVTIDTTSVDTGQEMRDNHLRSGDFFEVETHPAITFRSTRVEPAGGEEFKIHGNLTMHGVTREVTLDTTFNGRGVSPWGNEVISYSAETKLDRREYGLNYNAALEAGGVLVGDTIKIAIEIEATPATPDAAQE